MEKLKKASKIVLVISIIIFIINKITINDFVVGFFSFNFALLAIICLIEIELWLINIGHMPHSLCLGLFIFVVWQVKISKV